MSSKESELLQIFRELMACDLYVPDHRFDRQLLAERRAKKVAKEGSSKEDSRPKESYTIPLNVFWRPVELGERDYQPNLAHPEYQRKVNPMPGLTKETFGRFLAPPLREELRRTSLAKMEKLRVGGTESALHEVARQAAKSEVVEFDKYQSQG